MTMTASAFGWWTRRLFLSLSLVFALVSFASTLENNDISSDNDEEGAYTEVRSQTELHTLIYHKDFGGALDQLLSFPEEASILVEVRSKNTFVWRHLPLHQAFAIDIPSHIHDAKTRTNMSREQCDLILELLKHNPHAATLQDHKKRVPLHYALASPNMPPVEIIHALLNLYPKSARVRDVESRIPLHEAVSYPMTLFENTMAVLGAYPDGVEVQDEDESLPIHLAALGGDFTEALPTMRALHEQNPSLLSVMDSDQDTALLLMAKYGRTSAEAVRYVLDQDPQGARSGRDEFEGGTILHAAVSSSHEHNSTVYRPFLESHREMAENIDRLGKLPLHVALWKCCANTEMILALIDAYPGAASKRDGEGYLPLHHACRVGVNNTAVVTRLLGLFPDGVKVQAAPKILDETGPLPAHLALKHPAEEGPLHDTMNEISSMLIRKYGKVATIPDPETGFFPLVAALVKRRPAELVRQIMVTHPKAVSMSFEIDLDGEMITTTAMHLFMTFASTYMTPLAMKGLIKQFVSLDPESPTRTDSHDRVPMFDIWRQVHATDKRRDVLVETMLAVHQDGALQLDDELMSPLTFACIARDASGVRTLLNAHPLAASMPSKSGKLPLHYLCEMGAVGHHTEKLDQIMSMLLHQYPQAAGVEDENGNLPLHIVSRIAGIERFAATTIQKLVDAYPEAASTPGQYNMYPLTIAVKEASRVDGEEEREYWVGLFDVLRKAYPEAAKLGKRIPLVVAMKEHNPLSNARRREDDHLLYMMQELYKIYPESVAKTEGRGRNALHTTLLLIGDMGGMTPRGWADFAMTMIRDFPALTVASDGKLRTPLHLFVLYLGDTAIGMRDKQNPATMVVTQELTDVMTALLVTYPHAMTLTEEFNMTPLDTVTHRRLWTSKGSVRYRSSPILKMIKHHLRRGVRFWELVGAKDAAVEEFLKGNLVCNTLASELSEILEETEAQIERLEIEPAPLDDNYSCQAEHQKLCRDCPDETQLLRKIIAYLEVWAAAAAALSDEEDLKPLS